MFGFFPNTEALLGQLERETAGERETIPPERLKCPMCGRPSPVAEKNGKPLAGELRCWNCDHQAPAENFPEK